MPLGMRTYRGGPQTGYGYGGRQLTRDETRGVFGQVMGLVAVTFGFLALGGYIGRDMVGGSSFLFILLALGCMFGLNAAARRGREQLAIALLLGLGLCFGLFLAPTLNYYSSQNPGVVYEAAGATAGFTALLGSWGYATRRDLSQYYRFFFWGIIAVIAIGLITLFVSVPGGNIIYCVLGLAVFGGLTAFDFQRLRNSGMSSAVPIAAAIFLDVLNIFLFFLSLFGGGGRRR